MTCPKVGNQYNEVVSLEKTTHGHGNMANMIVYLVSWNTQVISSSRGADSG
jgi:hypothetical protein